MRRYRYSRKKYSPESALAIVILGLALGIATGVISLEQLKPLFVSFIIIATLVMLYKYNRHDQLSKTGIFDIDKMTGPEFEERLEVLYRNLGYSVERTGKTGDAGVDLIVEKNGIRTAIQAKRYADNVGETAVQQVHTGKSVYHCDNAIIVTNSNFTKMAWKVAKATNVKLWSRNYLVKVLMTEHDKLSNRAKRESTSESKSDSGISDMTSEPSTENITSSSPSDPKPQDNISPTHTQRENPAPPQLLQYISEQISTGQSLTDIKARLLKAGWKDEIVNKVLSKIPTAP